MKELKFNYNWNNKLDCKAFTTLRLSNRLNVGDDVKIMLRRTIKGYAKVIGKEEIYLQDINAYIAYIDTGYSTDECRDVLIKMYKNKDVNWKTQKIYHYLLKYQEPVKEEQPTFFGGEE